MLHTHTHTHTHTHFRFVSKMPTPTLFILFSFLLRIVEGVGTAMYSSVSYTVLIQLYPNKKGTVVVSVSLPELLAFLHHKHFQGHIRGILVMQFT